jgi:hypothetical protein
MGFKEEGANVWSEFAWFRILTGGGVLMNTVMNFRVP